MVKAGAIGDNGQAMVSSSSPIHTSGSGPLGVLRTDRTIGLGVAQRLGARWGAECVVIRVGFAVLALAAGVGIGLYALAAVLMAGRPERECRPASVRGNIGVGLLTASVMWMLDSLVWWLPSALLWAVLVISFGLLMSDPDGVLDLGGVRHQSYGGSSGETVSRRSTMLRIVAGGAFVVGGLATILASSAGLGELWPILAALAIVAGGLGVVFAPWLTSLLAVVEIERADRIRAQARSDMAAHLHDSVLQTLNLIQTRASDPQVAAALARQQERDLRRWLAADGDPTRLDDASAPDTLRHALESMAGSVEDQYLVAVECIVVGDAPLDHDLEALVAATREALVNGAKFAGSPLISLYAELDELGVRAFVRDRGKGFDLAAVPADRQGIRMSIQARLDRIGGSAMILSEPGKGTEVRLEVPR